MAARGQAHECRHVGLQDIIQSNYTLDLLVPDGEVQISCGEDLAFPVHAGFLKLQEQQLNDICNELGIKLPIVYCLPAEVPQVVTIQFHTSLHSQ
jgi:hypothetical protein